MRRATPGSGIFRRAILCCLALGPVATATAQPSAERPPVIDMHAHSTTTTPAALARLDSLGVRFVFLGTLATDLPAWRGVDPARVLTALVFPCEGGRAVITGRACFETTAEFPDTTWLRAEIVAGRVRGFGELLPHDRGWADVYVFALLEFLDRRRFPAPGVEDHHVPTHREPRGANF